MTGIEKIQDAHVRINVGLTKNLGNYEFLRIDVELKLPCTEDDVDETYIKVSETVSELLECEVKKYNDQLKKNDF